MPSLVYINSRQYTHFVSGLVATWRRRVAGRCGGDNGGDGRSLGTFKDQLISVGSLFVISGNPLEPGSVSTADNQGKQKMEEEMNACPCTCTTKVAVDLTVILHRKAPRGDATNCYKKLSSMMATAQRAKNLFALCSYSKMFYNPNCLNVGCRVGKYDDLPHRLYSGPSPFNISGYIIRFQYDFWIRFSDLDIDIPIWLFYL